MNKKWVRKLGSFIVAGLLTVSAIMGDIMPVYADLLIDDSQEDKILSVDNVNELSEDVLVEDIQEDTISYSYSTSELLDDNEKTIIEEEVVEEPIETFSGSNAVNENSMENASDTKFEIAPEGAASDFTADQAISWVAKKVDSSLDWDGAWGAQCVDLIAFYQQYLGVPVTKVKGAKDYATVSPPSGWCYIPGTHPQKGDILVYGPFTGWFKGYYVENTTGHVGIYESDYVTYHQNYLNEPKVRKIENIAYNGFATPYWGVLRPNFKSSEGRILGANEGAGRSIPDGDYQIISALGSDLTLDIPGNAIPAPNGAKIGVWHELDRAADIFHVEYLGGTNGYYKITQKGTNQGLVIGGPDPSLGAEDIIWGYDKSNLAFQWSILSAGDGYCILQNRYGGYCLDVGSGDETKPIENGRDVIQWEINGSDSQRWGFVQAKSIMGSNDGAGKTIADGDYVLGSALDSNITLDIPGDKIPAENGAKMQVWRGLNRPADIFHVEYLGGTKGYYKITQKGTNQGLVVGGPGLQMGATDCIWGYYKDNLAFQWSIIDAGNGYYILKNRYGGYCLDVGSGDEQKPVEDGRDVVQWEKNNSNSQKWKFISVKAPSITTASLPGGTTGKSYSTTISATSDTAITWSCSGALPAGLTFSNGKISGTPTKAGTYNITVTAKNTFASSSKTYSIKIDQATVSVTGVSLNKSSTSIIAGKTETLTATVAPSNATNKSVTWTSSNTNVATVSNTGVVTARAQGTATITVKTVDGNKTATCKVTVNPAIISVTGVSLNKSSTNIIAGNTESLTATISPSNATNKNVTWTSSNSNVATVTSSGVVTARTEGTADITVKTADGGKSTVCRVSVVTPPQHVVETYSPDGRVGVPYSFTFESDGTKPLTWEVLDLGSSSYEIPKGLTLSSSGVLSGIPEKAGAYQFYITVSNAYGKYGFYCKTAILGEKLSFSLDSLPKGKVGEYYDITIQPISDTPYYAYINIEGEDENSIGLRAVNGNGLRICGTPTKAGVFTVVCEGTNYDGHSEKRYDLVIEGNKAVTGVELNKSTTTIVAGNPEALRATVTPYDAADKTVTWTSSNTNVATVTSDGLVTAKAEGTADIKVKTNDGGKTATCKVRVVTIPGITTSSLPNGRVGDNYTISMTASGTTPITWSIISGNLPDGLTLYSDGTIRGIPTAPGTYAFSVQAKNAYGSSPAKQLSIKINSSKPEPGPEDDPNGIDPIIVAGQRIDLKEVCFKDVNGAIDRYVVEDRKIASISKSMLSGKKAGTVNVTAQRLIGKNSYEDIATCTVTVLNKPKLKFTVPMTYEGQMINASDYFITSDTNTLGATFWESSKPDVVEVTDSTAGLLTAHKSGSAKITAYFGEKGKTGTLKVSATINVKKPAFQKSDYKLLTGGKAVLAMKNVVKAQNPEWVTEDENVAVAEKQLDKNGQPTGKVIVKALNCGDTVLTARIDGQEYKCTIHVGVPKISKTKLTIKVNKNATVSLKNTKLPKSSIEWYSENPDIAAVSPNGKVKGIEKGQTIIYTETGGVRNECVVTVK